MNSLIIDIDGTLCPIKKPDESYSDLIPYKNMIEKLKQISCNEKLISKYEKKVEELKWYIQSHYSRKLKNGGNI